MSIAPQTGLQPLRIVLGEPPSLRQRLVQLRNRVARCIERLNAVLCIEARSSLPFAQIISYVFARRDQRGVIYDRTVSEAVILANVLRHVGFKAKTGLDAERDFDDRQLEILVRVTGQLCQGSRHAVGYVLHVSSPTSIESYVTDLIGATNGKTTVASTVHCPPCNADPESEFDVYCRSRVCRYAQIVRRREPSLIEPPPHVFSCYHCDVCFSEPHGIHEEECGELITV